MNDKLIIVIKILTIVSIILSIYQVYLSMDNITKVNVSNVENVNVTLDDIKGLSEQKEWIRKVMISKVKPNGILLYGPPGTGKTMIAKAIASSMNGKFINITPSMLQSKFYGETPKLVESLFETAKNNKPCILFFDEMDGLFNNRSFLSEQPDRILKTTLLSCMDGINDYSDGVMYIGATNRLEDIDPAVKRRFRMQINVPLPQLSTIAEMLLLDPISKNDSIISSSGSGLGSEIDIVNKEYKSYKNLVKRIVNKGLSCSDIKQLNIFVNIDNDVTINGYNRCLDLFF